MTSLVKSVEPYINQPEPAEGIDSICLLNDYRNAWPLISQMQQKPNDLIDSMKHANQSTLEAFKRITSGSDWSALAETFLLKNNKELQLLNRQQVIDFLRHAHWMEQENSLSKEANRLMSLHFLSYLVAPFIDEHARLQRLRSLCLDYPFSVNSDALLQLVTVYEGQLKQKKALTLNKEFIVLLDDLLKKMLEIEQEIFFKALPGSILRLLFEHCIEYSGQLESTYQNSYKRLLFLLCTEIADVNSHEREYIHAHINNLDRESTSVHHLSTNLDSQGKGTPWFFLQALFLSSRFMASTTSSTIKKLKLHYRCVILTLNHEEQLSFIASSKEANPYYEFILVQLDAIEDELSNGSRQNNLRARKQRLLHWCIDRSIHSLFSELIKQCHQEPEDAYHREALTQVCRYYSEHSSLRWDLSLQIADHFYSKEKQAANSPLATWSENYLFSHSCNIKEIDHPMYLYDAQSVCIAFLDEFNQMWSLTGDEPCLYSAQEESNVYNQAGLFIGTLNETGHFRHASESPNLSARLLSVVPKHELEQSDEGLSWLINSMLLENTIDLLYQDLGSRTVTNHLKQQWLEQKIAHIISEASCPPSPSTLDSIVAYVHLDVVFSLCSSIPNSINALAFFHSLIKSDKTRDLFFSGIYEAHIHPFLQRQNASLCLAEYVLHYHHKTWFLEGLRCFATFASTYKNSPILSEAIGILFVKVKENTVPLKLFNQCLLQLIASEEAVFILLQQLCGDVYEVPVQEIRTIELNEVLTHFTKKHLLSLVSQLNKKSSWQECSAYRFTLFILQSQHERLLAPKQAGSSLWKNHELNELASFINRHLEEKNPWDRKAFIGHKVLGALLFHCAAAGQITLFFKEKNQLSRTATYSVNPVLLGLLVDKFILLSSFKENKIQESKRAHRDWRHYRTALAHQLKDDNLVQEWHSLLIAAHTSSDKKIPIICPYLLHYTGSTQKVLQLLGQYFARYFKYPKFIHPVSQLMEQFPSRSVSAVIFDALQLAVIRNPQLLDGTVFTHMAAYFAKKKGGVSAEKRSAELQLLTYWGQEKHYTLVRQGCSLLLCVILNKTTKQQLVKAALEARVEHELEQLLDAQPWYGALIKWCKRLWYYGFNWEKNTSHILFLCDAKPLPSIPLVFSNPEVSIPVRTNDGDGFEQQHQQFINLLAQIQLSITACEPLTQTKHPQSLFYDKSMHHSANTFDELASQQAMANV
jgi:hypothetical protein